jgi:HAD superfamily hydrolase (TIGR01509 family)
MRRMTIEEYVEAFEAILFDLDGTLVDTMPVHYRAYAEVLRRRGLELGEPDFMAAIGAPAREAIPRFLAAVGIVTAAVDEVAAIHAEKKLVFERLLGEIALAPLAAARLLQAARGRNKLALVSSGNRAGIAALLSAMRWSDVFDVVVSGDDVTHGKPDPEPYLMAAARLGVAPGNCLVVEDTEAGLASGRAAGMTVLNAAEFARLKC